MKSLKTLWIVIAVVCLLPTFSFAKDTDLYMASGEGVEPNILIIFDNSGSMGDTVPGPIYDPATTYDPLVVSLADKDKVYYRQISGTWALFTNTIAQVACANARTALTNYGHYEGNTNAACSRTRQTLRTGNYQNYLSWITNDPLYNTAKLRVAKNVVQNFLNTVHGVRLGVMVFNYSEGGRLHSGIRSLDSSTRTQLISDIEAIDAETWTPLAETLYEAGLYFKGGSSYFNGGVSYTSPIQYHCQRNYVIIVTDGMPTQDRNTVLGNGATGFPSIGDRDGDRREPIGAANDPNYADSGSDYLDDVAKYLYDTDRRSDMTGTQNVITYTIGFTQSNNLLERTAAFGHGRYYYAESAQELSNAFQNIVGDILEKTSSFVAPIVPVSRMERTSAGDKIYLALFQPNQNTMWSGNLKKYGIGQSGVNIGQLLDVNGLPAIDDHGQIRETARSYWTAISMDGSDVEKGGVGEALLIRNFSTNPRKIYTYLGTQANLTHSSNAFNTTNITPTMLGLGTDTVGRDNLVQYVYGYDAYDDEPPYGSTAEKREWILGAFLHSRPQVVHYASRSVIYAGSNDGMLHAFDDSTGEELWSFIPPNLFNKLQALHADVVESFVDGSPKMYIARNTDGSINRAIMILGERRGGNQYYALDVTNPLSPQYVWEINPDSPGSPYAEMGQSWSSPNIVKIAYGAGEKWVAIIGGGYDEGQDNATPPADDRGRAVYVVDVLDGSLVRRFSVSDAGYSNMTYCIPSDVARVDIDGDGKVDRLYVGDLGGRMWRFDIEDPDPAAWSGKIVFTTPAGSKIFYPPDITLEKDSVNYEMLFFGTGDREDPKETTVVNRIYGVKDKNPATPLTEADLVDVTTSLLSGTGTTNGWFIRLTNAGEKSLAPPVVFYKAAYYTTFTPTFGVVGDPCFVGEGTARLYIVQYQTGNPAFNLDLSNDAGDPVLDRTDRSKVIGTAIPSGVIITFIQGKAVAYVGVGGGVRRGVPDSDLDPDSGDFPIPSGKSLVPTYWRTVF